MDLTKLSKSKLLEKCEELGITKYKSKNKSILIDLIHKKQNIEFIIEDDKITEIEPHTIQNISVLNEMQSKFEIIGFTVTPPFE